MCQLGLPLVRFKPDNLAQLNPMIWKTQQITPIVKRSTGMSIVDSGRNELGVGVVSSNTTLSSLSVEGSIVDVCTGLVKDTGRTVGVRVPAVALVVEIDRGDLRVHSSETVTGNGEDETSVVVLSEDVGPVIGLILGLHVSLSSESVDGARSAVLAETEVVPSNNIVIELLLELVVTLEDDQSLVHLGNNGSEALCTRCCRAESVDYDPWLSVRVGKVLEQSCLVKGLSRAESVVVSISVIVFMLCGAG